MPSENGVCVEVMQLFARFWIALSHVFEAVGRVQSLTRAYHQKQQHDPTAERL